MYIDVITLHFLQVGFVNAHCTNNTPSKHSFIRIGILRFILYDLDWLQCLDTVSTNQKVHLNIILFTNFTQYWLQVFPFFKFLLCSYFTCIYWKLMLCVCWWKNQPYFLRFSIGFVNL